MTILDRVLRPSDHAAVSQISFSAQVAATCAACTAVADRFSPEKRAAFDAALSCDLDALVTPPPSTHERPQRAKRALPPPATPDATPPRPRRRARGDRVPSASGDHITIVDNFAISSLPPHRTPKTRPVHHLECCPICVCALRPR